MFGVVLGQNMEIISKPSKWQRRTHQNTAPQARTSGLLSTTEVRDVSTRGYEGAKHSDSYSSCTETSDRRRDTVEENEKKLRLVSQMAFNRVSRESGIGRTTRESEDTEKEAKKNQEEK